MNTFTLALLTLLLAACGTAKGVTSYTPFDCPAPRTVQACIEGSR